MKCTVCEGDTFTFDEGLQICNVCRTVVEEFVQLESEEFLNDLDKSRLIHFRKQKVKKEKVKPTTNWTNYEVYNVIFREWTKALCNLGASPCFEQIAFELWVLYMQRSGIAFLPMKKEKDSEDCKSSALLNRRYSYSMCMAQEESSNISLEADLPCFNISNPNNIGLPNLLGLLYLAVLLAEEPILLMDIIRWCREGHIPYLSAQNLLSQDCNAPSKLVWPEKLPKANYVKNITESLVLFLNIVSLPIPPLNDVTERMVKLLRLPELVGSLALEHMKKIMTSEESIPVIAIERYAMAAVIVVIKAYWGTNDWDELHLSHATRRINEDIGGKSKVTPLFCWLDWQRYINKLIWFCGEIDPVTRMHSRSFEAFNLGDADSYAKFLWTEGIWRLGTKSTKIEPHAYSVVEKVLGAQNSSLADVLNMPMIFKATKEPFYSIVEQFIEVHGSEPQYDHQVKMGKELLEISFAASSFKQPSLDILGKEIKKYGSDIAINALFATGQMKSSKLNVYIPQPLETVLKTTYEGQRHWSKWQGTPSESMKWLLDIGSLFCEECDYNLLEIVAIIENLY